MILRFPSVDVLQLALTSEVVAHGIECAPARVAEAEDDTVLIDTSRTISRAMMAELKKLGVESKRNVKADFRPIVSWHQAVPVAASAGISAEGGNSEVGDKSEVLFEIDDQTHMPVIVGEMLRLGNDRQSFRFVDENGTAKALLRVTGPPYYTMLRATDRSISVGYSGDVAMTAYVEQAPRVWVQVGYRHPLGNRLNPPAGKWLLISRDNRWRFLKERAFRDIYEAIDFALPDVTESFADQEPSQRIEVPLALTAGSSQEPAELWVLTHDALTQVEKLVASSDDRVISRLAFAVAMDGINDDDDPEAGPTVIIRARPSKQPPPVLVLCAVACRSYLKIPNLFLPVGQRLHPPLRRDAVARLLTRQADQITWLMPGNEGQFTPQSIPDAAFRPMSDWVDYVIDHESEPLAAWIASHKFDFEHFTCPEDLENKKPGPAKKRPVREPAETGTTLGNSASAEVKVEKRKVAERAKADDTDLEFIGSSAKKPKKKQLQLRLCELEKAFKNSTEPLDSPVRATMWREMGLANAALKHRHDTTICWANSLWDQATVDTDSSAKWLQCEQHCSSVGKLTSQALDTLMSDRAARSSQPSLVAAYLVWAASCDAAPAAMIDRQTDLTQFLQRQEGHLPIRAAWLAWCAMYEISGLDVLLLARARDRLLERLFNRGLAPEFDMAAFMRTGGMEDGDRFRVLRDQLLQLRELASRWVIEPPLTINPQTKSYADLVFAFALARLGETAHCNEMLKEISATLDRSDVIHRWALDAFSMRIKQALAGQATAGHLSDDLLQELESMDRMDRYKIDRLRANSRVLEPHVRIDPYLNWHQRYADDLSRELAMLQNVVDREQLSARITELISEHPSSADRIRILPVVLQLSPRVGEKFARGLLDQVPAVIGQCHQPMEKAILLQRGLHIAAHYGRVDLLHAFVIALKEALPTIVTDYLEIELQMKSENKEKTEAIESLLTQSFRGLRKLGTRDEIGQLYGIVADMLEGKSGNTKSKRGKGAKGEASRAQRLLLCVAGGWYYFGQEEPARAIVDKVRTVLQSGELSGVEQKNLTCAYLDAVSQAPVDESLARVQQIFAVNKKGELEFPRISDSMTTCSHFSISQFDVIEAAVLSLISDDFSLSVDARRWLDEDEFLVRSRIHRDMRQASGT